MLSVSECRTLLGDVTNGKSDAQVEEWRDGLAVIANQMFDHLQTKVRAEREEPDNGDDLPGFSTASDEERKQDALERIRWIAYAHENPDDEDAK